MVKKNKMKYSAKLELDAEGSAVSKVQDKTVPKLKKAQLIDLLARKAIDDWRELCDVMVKQRTDLNQCDQDEQASVKKVIQKKFPSATSVSVHLHHHDTKMRVNMELPMTKEAVRIMKAQEVIQSTVESNGLYKSVRQGSGYHCLRSSNQPEIVKWAKRYAREVIAEQEISTNLEDLYNLPEMQAALADLLNVGSTKLLTNVEVC